MRGTLPAAGLAAVHSRWSKRAHACACSRGELPSRRSPRYNSWHPRVGCYAPSQRRLAGMHSFRCVGNDFVDINLRVQKLVNAALHLRFEVRPDSLHVGSNAGGRRRATRHAGPHRSNSGNRATVGPRTSISSINHRLWRSISAIRLINISWISAALSSCWRTSNMLSQRNRPVGGCNGS